LLSLSTTNPGTDLVWEKTCAAKHINSNKSPDNLM
jgi:hypothetical protein